jgi:glycosyltransferase involved in cell wall biosynthesis
MKPSWTYHRRASARLLRRRWNRHAERHPGHRLRVLCNSDLEVDTLRREGLDAEVVHQNAMLDERIFNIHDEIDPEFDAVYDAQLAPFKRHDLAKRLDSLALITYLDRRVRGAVGVADWTRRMPGWRWLNWPADHEKPTHFKQPRLARELARCRVGLCLSPVEGAMYASMQYLLCGLPVVSVPSFGGRDVFFDREYAAVVPADAGAVAAGVKEMLSRRLSRREVREAVLPKMHAHRRRLIDIVQSIYDREGVRRRFADEWPAVFVDKLMSTPHAGELRAQLAPPAMVA